MQKRNQKQFSKTTLKKKSVIPRKPRAGHTRSSSRPSQKKDAVRTTATKTSWGKEATWYAEHLEQGDTYHSVVILPNLLRIVEPKRNMQILEIGCGEGFVARALAEKGATLTASDISPELIQIAKEKGEGPEYSVAPSDDLSWVRLRSQDVVVAVLTLQNTEHIEAVMKQVSRTLVPGGRFVFVLNHPTFRVPKATSWGFDQATGVQYRRVDAYLSARSEKMDMHPGKRGSKSFTYSYHRSLQDYMKALRGAGFCITRLEEWISHKTSEPGPRAKAENVARKEFPLFMCIEATHVEYT